MNIFQGKIWPGQPYPLGANWDGEGVNFAIFSENALSVTLCLFDQPKDSLPSAEIQVKEVTDQVWHVYLPGLKPGQLYGYKVDGPFNPIAGWRFNPHKLLLDPYAKSISAEIEVHESMFSYPIFNPDDNRDLILDEEDSTPFMPKCVVIDPGFDWEGVKAPNVEMHNSIIYELHVKGFTQLHPDVPEEDRGTYRGLAHPSVVQYFQDLGITTLELMPVHHFINSKHLLDRGVKNYWGYNSVGFFAPHSAYSASGKLGQQVKEFKELVKTYHKAGIEIILDVVYNHTGEGNHYGPTLNFRGIDNHNYYRLIMEDQRYYMDYTGTGNSLNMLNSRSLQLVMDSLRYWVTEMRVDGFRFDLAATLARGLYEVGKLSTFLDTIHQDPIISQVKLIAEPWDVGPGGYQVGNFPVLWAEWNNKYKESVRKFWKGDESGVAELAYRLSGSSDLYQDNGKLPSSSINFVTSHDGFTLHDLVSYNHKHNWENGEDNLDGERENHSWNCGEEGDTVDEGILALRRKQMRNFLATLLFSQGVPMISHGDEIGKTQKGNNNPYCQDNEITWINWDLEDWQKEQLEFTKGLIRIRNSQQVLHRRRYFKGRAIRGSGVKDILWLNTDTTEMTDDQWEKHYLRSMGMLLNGELMDEIDKRGNRIRDDILLMVVNSYWESLPFNLPYHEEGWEWEILVDTTQPTILEDGERIDDSYIEVDSRSLVLLRKIK